VPTEYRAEAIYEGLRTEDLGGVKILIPRAKMARDILPEDLRRAGAEVDVLEVYRTVRPASGAQRIVELLEKKEIAAVTFTSSSTVTHFVELIGKESASKLMKGVLAAAIGPITKETAQTFGIETGAMPKDYTIPALVGAICEYFKK